MGMGSEIGEGGMSVVLPAEFQVENQAVASFQILDGSFISVRVELRNIRKLPTGEHLVGCSFRGLKFEHKREIRAYVSARSELEQ